MTLLERLRPSVLRGDRKRGQRGSVVREYVEAILLAVALALFIRTFVVQAFKIPSGSMLPTLLVGDHLLVNKLLYGIRIPFVGKRVLQVYEPERDDIVVFIFPDDRNKDFIKRVQGVPGEKLEIRDKVLYINGEVVEDAFAHFPKDSRVRPGAIRDNFGPIVIPAGEVFVMGDNRDYSHDSRFWGTVPIDDIRGKAFVLYFSWDSEAFSPRWGRTGMLLH
ncbi:MAG: signal peptidase I [Hyphomicrobiaceae bacterium]|jgi:signal peptidase I